MEAVTIISLVVVAVGGYFSVTDFLNELGILGCKTDFLRKQSSACRREIVSPKGRIKKMAGMHI